MGRRKKEIKVKEPVRIREKRLNDGNVSLYLDMYYRGARRKEGLKLYLVPETDATAKLQNKNTRKLAEQIKAQRILDIQQNGLVNWEDVKKARMTLSAWVELYTSDECGLTPSSMRSKRNAQARVEQYLLYIGKPDLALKEVDKAFCKGFIAFLKTCTFNNGKKTLGSTTCRIFVNRLAAALNKAVHEGLIDRNPFKQLETKEKPQKRSTMREFLTIEELRSLIATPCRYEIVKKAFLFSCFTGLRYSDMKTLKWSEIHTAADGKTLYIEHEQIKTKNRVTIPLSDEAMKWLPRRAKDKDTVFHQLRITSTTVEVVLGEWVQEAGIQKHITYHCSRHTAATLLLTLGADLYTVSKILGHQSIKMTEVYAKIVDKKKIETMNLVNNLFA
ncbi:site-specific integrase [Parabacteroides merdae]|uniref:Tyrosine-type recombinase/integrase n=1 Tax=Parabacteroides merdae TaxID=46503 RepID=A0A7K1HE86_9BACT|nr:site-specific integrase [Parabacteroides merdae]MTU29426.1 tyrosine-type recombinase/integrase [Parabacteroides merdae]RYS83598.1 site-specific integrase [Parabacteroides merdae]